MPALERQQPSRLTPACHRVQSAGAGQYQPFIKALMFPKFWVNFLKENDLYGAIVELSDQLDISGLGVDLQFLTADQSIDEATNFWPGIGVANQNYYDLGHALSGL
jgi:hypothetical protein